MLTMTFSPMSTRPSSVAEPRCGSSTTLPALRELDELRTDRGLVLEHVEAGAGDFVRLDQARQRVLVDHLAARGVDDVGLGPDELEPPRRQQMIGRRRVRAIDRDDVHAHQHLVEAFPIGGVEFFLDLAARRGGDCGSGSAARTPWRAAPRPGRCGPCRRCRAACPRCDGRASRSGSSRSSRCRRSAPGRLRRAAAAPRGSAPWSCRRCPRSARRACW